MKNLYLIYRPYAVIIISFFMMMFVLALSQMNIKAKVETTSMKAPGDIVVSVVWDPKLDYDIDTWLSAPEEPIPVGYTNKGGRVWNLLRDDLGFQPDFGMFNYEDAFTRGKPPGEYTVNLHCFRCAGPIDVEVLVSMRDRADGSTESLKPILRTKVRLYDNKQERTAANFKVGADGQIIQSSVNSIFHPLLEAKK